MKYQTIQNLPRLLVVIGFAAFLAGCSSSSTTDTQTAGDLPDDSNGDGVIDVLDGDHNGNGSIDALDLDYNGDGFVDASDDINGDGFNDFADFDVNGDGFTDALDDTNGDGMVNSSDATTTNLGPCQGLAGTDPDSSDNDWGNNCVLSESAPYKDSSYSRGVQRILFCQGYAPDGVTIDSFADGSYGPNTKFGIESFQAVNSLDVDGIVGPMTWAALRDQLVLQTTGSDYDVWGVNSVDCNGQAMFYQKLNASLEGESWEMAETPGSATRVVFSTGF